MKHFLLLPVIILLFSVTAFSQTAQITGTIRDADTKDPLNGASVKFDKTRGAISDPSGKFVINIPAGERELTFSFIIFITDKRKG